MALIGPLSSNTGMVYTETTSDTTIGAGGSNIGYLSRGFSTTERGPITVSMTFGAIREDGGVNLRCRLRLNSTSSPYFPVAVQFTANHAQQTSGALSWTFSNQAAGSYTAYVDIWNQGGTSVLNYWSPGDSAYQNDILTVQYLTT